jgi:hypothetical protein
MVVKRKDKKEKTRVPAHAHPLHKKSEQKERAKNYQKAAEQNRRDSLLLSTGFRELKT